MNDKNANQNPEYNSFEKEEDSWDKRWEEKWSDEDDQETDSEKSDYPVVESLPEDSVSSVESYKEGMNGFSLAITATCIMVLPGVLGSWLDSYFQLKFLALAGILSGMTLAIAYLLISQNNPKRESNLNKKSPSEGDPDE